MKYRKADVKDDQQIEALCKKNLIDKPSPGTFIVVAEDDEKNIIAFIGVKKETYIEPYVCNNNPLVANNLFRYAEGVIMGNGIESYRCICDPKHEELFNRVGLVTIESQKLIMEKEF